MVFIVQKNSWLACGRYKGPAKFDDGTIIDNSAMIQTSKAKARYFWSNRKDARKQLSILEKNKQVVAWGFINHRKTNAKPLYVIHAIFPIPVPNVSLKANNGLDIEYAKYLENLNENQEFELDDFKVDEVD